MSNRVAAFVATLLVLTATASAQPGITAPLAPPSSVEGPPPPRAPLGPGAHRPAVSFFLGFGVDIGLLVAAQKGAFDGHPGYGLAAFVIAPSAGRWYIGELGVIGIAMRAGGLGILAIGAEGDSPAPIFAGLGVMLAGVLYDMIGAPISADRQNKRRWAATPTAITAANGSVTPGLALGGSF